MSGLKTKSEEPKVELNGILAEFRSALEEEIACVQRSGQSTILLHEGQRIKGIAEEFWYRFAVEYAPSLPADTPCKLKVGNEQYNVTVVGLEENAIVLSARSPLPPTLGKATLENGSTVLMERLIECIEAGATTANPAGHRMLPGGDTPYHARRIRPCTEELGNSRNTDSQKAAIRAALENDITYIWGPPGTGKTTVIGQIIYELYTRGRSVLLVSHTNTAVDGAIEKADKTYTETKRGEEHYPLLRLGAVSDRLPERVTLKAHIEVAGKSLYKRQKELESDLQQVRKAVNQHKLQLEQKAWASTTKIAQIYAWLQEKIAVEKEINNLREKEESIRHDLQVQEKDHPQLQGYAVLEERVKIKRKQLAALELELDSTEKLLQFGPKWISHAEDEAKKHQVYAALQIKANTFLSEEFIRDQIALALSRKVALETELEETERKLRFAEDFLKEYNAKGSIGRILAGKGKAIQAQEDISAAYSKIPAIKEKLHSQSLLVADYQRQLEEILLLKEQMSNVQPSYSEEYWHTRANECKEKYFKAQQAHAQLVQQQDALQKDLDKDEASLKRLIPMQHALQDMRKQLIWIQGELTKQKEKLWADTNRYEEALKHEREQCDLLGYVVRANTPDKMVQELLDLRAQIYKETASLDTAQILNELEKLKTRQTQLLENLSKIEQRLKEVEKQVVQNVKIVGTTLTKAYLDEILRARTFDTVILDEASMASIPALWCASGLAENSIVIVGDFLQLAPIVMSDAPMAKKWLGKDIFFHSGMQNAVSAGHNPPTNFVMLNQQFRMESEIADVANIYYGEYKKLVSQDQLPERKKEREKFYSWYSGIRSEHSIQMIDTANLHAWATGIPNGKRHSRLNCFSAAVDVDLAFQCVEKKLQGMVPQTADVQEAASVLIVAPYRAHIARIQKLIELEYKNRGYEKDLNLIRAGTVHSFQGSEADIVIFDLVVEEPHRKNNLFMTGEEFDESLRKMFNVAITRARFQLYIVGNFSFCQKRAKDNATGKLLHQLFDKMNLNRLDAKELLPELTFSAEQNHFTSNVMAKVNLLCRDSAFLEYFKEELHTFKKRMIIFSPFITENQLGNLLPDIKDATAKGKEIVVVTKALEDRGTRELYAYKMCERELESVGVSIVHKKGMHEKLVMVDEDTVWIGSLNVLSFTGLTGEVMHRFKSIEIAKEYSKIYEVETLFGSTRKLEERVCPICGEELLLRDGKDGGVFWQCVAKDFSMGVDEPYPKDGMLCCKCGGAYQFQMKKQPRWVCTNDARHYRSVRQSDLKLEKMAALIPNKKMMSAVKAYFAAHEKEKESSQKQQSKASKVIRDSPEVMQMSMF